MEGEGEGEGQRICIPYHNPEGRRQLVTCGGNSFLLPCGSGDRNEIVSLGSMCLYPLGHFNSLPACLPSENKVLFA